MLAADHRRLAFNTFTSPASIGTLTDLARMIAAVAGQTPVEYWLISEYRPMGPPSAAKESLHGYDGEQAAH
jgi:hypothetical protein